MMTKKLTKTKTKTKDQEITDDYKRGWYDGFQAGQLVPGSPIDIKPPYKHSIGCSRCGINFDGTMGYVCPNLGCPLFPRNVC